MMKMKRTMALLVAVLLIAGMLAGCNGGNGGGGGGDVDEVTIGMLAPLTGPVAQFGVAVYQGANLYIEQFNARGGLQINPIILDEEGDPILAVTMYHNLVDQGVTAILGSVTSGPTMAVVPLAYEDNMPMITATATHANVTINAETNEVFTNMFRSCFIDPFQGQKMAEFAVEVLGAQTAAVLYSNEIDYSIGLKEAFYSRAGELGLEIVQVETFPDEAIDYRSQLTNIAAMSPDVLFIPAYYRHIGLIGPQSQEVGLEGTTLLGADGWATITDFMGAEASAINGSFFLTGFSPDAEEPRIQEFITNYQARWGEMPNMFAAQAYDAAMILIAAIEETLANTDYEPGSDAFRTALIANMAATDLTGVTGHVTYDEFNNPQKSAIVLEVIDGQETYWGEF